VQDIIKKIKKERRKYKKIKIIVPITLKSFRERAEREYKEYISKGCMFKDLQLDVEILQEGEGPLTIQSEYDGAMAERGAIALVEKAERDGYDGVVIDCFCDSGYYPAREVVGIPVVAAFETSIRFAQLLGDNISIVTPLKSNLPRLYRKARAMGADNSIVSIPSIETHVAKLGESKGGLIRNLEDKMIQAIEKDRAQVFVLGCTGMMGVAAAVQNKLKDKGYDVPVVNPAETCFRFMECLLVMGIKQSELSFPKRI